MVVLCFGYVWHLGFLHIGANSVRYVSALGLTKNPCKKDGLFNSTNMSEITLEHKGCGFLGDEVLVPIFMSFQAGV